MLVPAGNVGMGRSGFIDTVIVRGLLGVLVLVAVGLGRR